MSSFHVLEQAAKRARNVQSAAFSSRSECAEQPATYVASELAATHARNRQHGAASSGSSSAQQAAISVTAETTAKRKLCFVPSDEEKEVVSDDSSEVRDVDPEEIEEDVEGEESEEEVVHSEASSDASHWRRWSRRWMAGDDTEEEVEDMVGDSSSAERPATSALSAQSIVFITCGASSHEYEIARLQLSVHKALEARATIVNIAFVTSSARDLVDSDAILPKLRSVFDATWTGSVGQPAYMVRNIGSVMSFFLCPRATLLSETILDPEGCSPALMLTFRASDWSLCIIISSLPELSRISLSRIFNCYVDAAADSQANNILIGGRWQGTPICMENLVANLNFFTNEFFTNERLCLLAHTPDCAPVKCFPLGSMLPASLDGPYSFMGVWEKAEGEQHACTPPSHLTSVEPDAPCNLPPEVWTRVTALVGSHQPLVTRWLAATIHWTPTRHHQRCGQCCRCCRSENKKIIDSCEACNDLWQMKCVCTGFKIILQAYGRQC